MFFMVVFADFFRLQRTLILYPGNIPEFVLSEDILSLQKVSLRLGIATDFYLNKKLQVVEYYGTRSGELTSRDSGAEPE